MNADELVLEWIKSKLPQWYNEKIERLSEALEHSPGGPSAVSWKKELVVLEHLQGCNLAKAIAPDHRWECGCYSEYTRDDDWLLQATIVCGHMLSHEYVRRLHNGEVPQALEELFQLDERDCPYANEYGW